MWPLSAAEVALACRAKCDRSKIEDVMISGASSDSRYVQKGELFVAIRGEKLDGHDYVVGALQGDAALALVAQDWAGLEKLTPELRTRCLVVEDVLTSFRSLAQFLRQRFSFPVIGIAGSNGKTTTKEMIAAFLSGKGYRLTKTEKSENGFLGIGKTITSRQHSLQNAPHVLALEIGIDATGAMEEHVALARPDVVLLTAMGPEHVEGLGSWENGIEEEYKIFKTCTHGIRIWQTEDPAMKERLGDARNGDTVVARCNEPTTGKKVFVDRFEKSAALRNKSLSLLLFSSQEDGPSASRMTVGWYPATSETDMPAWSTDITVPLPGQHNVQNCALALATALAMNRTPREVMAGWENFAPPPMRSRVSTLSNGCVLYDDCYNASPASMKAAIDALRNPAWETKQKLLILGDMRELGTESKKWHIDLARYLGSLQNVHLCFYGTAMYDAYQEFQRNPESAKANNCVVSYLEADKNPTRFLEETRIPLNDAVVLVKGSRSMDLGRVVARVEEMCR